MGLVGATDLGWKGNSGLNVESFNLTVLCLYEKESVPSIPPMAKLSAKSVIYSSTDTLFQFLIGLFPGLTQIICLAQEE